MSDAARWAQVTALFQEALERDGAARAAYLDAACARDGALRAEVESLLAAHQAAGRFAEGSPLEAMPRSAVAALDEGVARQSHVSPASRAPLSSGARLGPYEIVGPLNAGGMGELFRARDTRLGREVAIKVPFANVAGDDDRRRRFQREARAIAALNHPHICTVHDVGLDSGLDYLVLELLSGESLASRLKRGALPMDEALGRAIEIASALDRAHRAGIVHRDLKPGNVMLTPSGAKVLDFGLARVTQSDTAAPASAGGLAAAPLTETGAVLGTLQYMAPEQLEGRSVDARADIFAFGATLHEMLSGKRAFEASSSAGLIAAILRGETPSLAAALPDLPPALDRIVRTCLQKDPEARFASVHDVAMSLQWVRDENRVRPPSGTQASDAPPRRRFPVRMALVAFAAATVLGAAVSWVALRPGRNPSPTVMRVEVVPSPADPINVGATTPSLAMSRDGTRIAYVSGRGGAGPLIVRDIGEVMPRRVEGAPPGRNPFFSPDGQWIGFFDVGRLGKVAVTGGTPVVITATDRETRGASWAEDGTIVYATTDLETGLWRVSEAGGTPTLLTKPNRDRGEADHVFPSVLPGGGGILFTILDSAGDNPRVAVLNSRDQSQTVVVPGAASAYYIDAGYLVYVASGTLFAVRFNLDRLSVEGSPLTLANGVLMGAAAGAYYAVSQGGTLAYVPETATPDPPRTLVWLDRQGTETPLNAPPRPYRTVRLSPDGQRVALTINDQRRDVWTWDLQRQTLIQITSDGREDAMPTWTPDSQRLVFNSRRAGGANLYRQLADGTGAAEPLTEGQSTFVPTSITSDGGLLFGHSSIPRAWTLFVLPLGKSGPPEPLLPSLESYTAPAVSPNGRFIAYRSQAQYGYGRDEIYVRPFPNVNEGRVQVSPAGGSNPVWARNGRELFFLDAADRLTAVPVDTTGAAFRAGLPAQLLSTPYWVAGSPTVSARSHLAFDVSPDGTRFLMIKEDPAARPPNTPIVLVLNAIKGLAGQGASRR